MFNFKKIIMKRKILKLLKKVNKFEIDDPIGNHSGQIYLNLDKIYDIFKNRYNDSRNIDIRITDYFNSNYTKFDENVAKEITLNSEKLKQLIPKFIDNDILKQNGDITYINIDTINEYLNLINTFNRFLEKYKPIISFILGLIGGISITLVVNIVININ